MADFNPEEFGDARINLSDEEEVKLIPEKSEKSFMTTLKEYINFSKPASSEDPFPIIEPQSPFVEKVKNLFQVEKSYKKFMIFLSVGVGFIFLSMLFLPVVLFSPQKFVFLSSLGSFMTIYSFIFYYGTNDFISMIFGKRKLYSIGFLASIFLGFYFTYKPTYYLVSLLCSAVQMIVMVIYVLTFVPGGKGGIALILNMLTSPVKNIFNKQ